MASRNNSEHLRFRYGMCLNDNCSKCKSKEVQQIAARKDFVCSECGKPLRECPPPKNWWDQNGKWVIIVAIIVLAAVGVGVFLLLGGDEKKEPKIELPQAPSDSVKTEPVKADSVQVPEKKDTVATEPAPQEQAQKEESEEKTVVEKSKNPKYGTVNLGYGVYTGDLKNGKPHGFGKIKYTKQHKIVSSQEYVAFPGDIYEGEFRDGRVSGSFGYWYHDGTQTAIKP